MMLVLELQERFYLRIAHRVANFESVGKGGDGRGIEGGLGRAGQGRAGRCVYLDVAASSVQIQMQILDLAILAKCVLNGFLVGFLVDVGDNDDPALDGAHSGRFEKRLHVVNLCRRRARARGCARGDGLVNVHLYVGHDC